MTDANNTVIKLFPPENANWAARLYQYSLLLFAFVCTFSISASEISLGLALIGCLVMIKQRQIEVRYSGLTRPFYFLVFSGILSIFVAQDVSGAIVTLKYYLLIMVFNLFFWPRMRKEYQMQLLNVFISSAVLVTIVNNWQILLGITEARHTRGFFSICITFGECMGLAALTTMCAYAENKKGKKAGIILLTAAAIISVSLVQAMTRGAWLGFAIGLLILAIRYPRRMIPVFLITAITGTLAATQIPAVRERITGFNLRKTVDMASQPLSMEFENIALFSNMQRLYIWKRGFIISDSSLPFGVGLRNVKLHYNSLASDFERENDLIWGHQHNNFMQMFAMSGFTGLIAFFYFAVATLRFLFSRKSSDEDDSSFEKCAPVIFIAFLVYGLTEYCWGDEEVVMTMLFLVGLMINRSSSDTATTGSSHQQPRAIT